VPETLVEPLALVERAWQQARTDDAFQAELARWFRDYVGRPSPISRAERLEAACDRALKINARTLSSVNSILQNRLDGRSPDSPPEAPPITHANIRGPRFFH
jgi:hypothetical protein